MCLVPKIDCWWFVTKITPPYHVTEHSQVVPFWPTDNCQNHWSDAVLSTIWCMSPTVPCGLPAGFFFYYVMIFQAVAFFNAFVVKTHLIMRLAWALTSILLICATLITLYQDDATLVWQSLTWCEPTPQGLQNQLEALQDLPASHNPNQTIISAADQNE